MNLLFSCVGRRGYIAQYFRQHMQPGDRIFGTGNTRLTPGFRHCDSAILLPDFSDETYLDHLLQACEDHRIDAVLSFSDPDIHLLSHHRDRFEALGVTPILPSAAASQAAFDKYQTYEFCLEHGFATPQTYWEYWAAEAAIAQGILTFPVIVKPRCGSGSQGIFKAHNLAQLKVFFDYAPDMLIQEIIPGDEYGLDICADLQGQVLGVVPRQKIAMRAGETDQAQTCKRPELLELGVRLGEALGIVGPLDTDVILKDGIPHIIDINPRFGGGYPIAQLAGADYPGLICRMLRGEVLSPSIGSFQSDVVMLKEYSVLGGLVEQLFVQEKLEVLNYREGKSRRRRHSEGDRGGLETIAA